MFEIKTKRENKPLVVLFYGVHGIGKTSFAAGAEKPIFIGVEENDEFDVPRMPVIKKWQNLKDQLSFLLKEKHEFKTVVIDTIDGLEVIAQDEILSGKDAGKTMATAMGGYGKAYEKMADMFIEIRDHYLAKLRENGMQIVTLFHSEKVKFDDPILAINYDTYQTAAHKNCRHIFQDWAQVILFANYAMVKAENSQGKEYAEGLDGERVIFTEERPSHIGKNRFGLPYELKFPKVGAWKILKDHVVSFYGKPEKKTVEKVVEKLAEIVETQKKTDNVETQDSIQFSALKNEALSMLSKIDDEMMVPAIQKAIDKATEVKEIERIIEKMKKM